MFWFEVAIAVVLFITGIFLLVFSHKLILYFVKVISLKPRTSSQIDKISIWKLRLLGIFHILIALFISIALAVPQALHYIPVYIVVYIVCIPILIYLILSLVTLVFYFKSKKAIPKEPNIQG